MSSIRLPSTGPIPERGMTLVEALLALTLASVLMLSLGDVIANMLDVRDDVTARNALVRDARFAMARMIRSADGASRLILPLVENPATAHSESVRNPGIVAFTIDPTLDRNHDGVPDADNDGDGRVDEDLPDDANNDNAPGLAGLDDSGNGVPDDTVTGNSDDDEHGSVADEDPMNGTDDDGDYSIDEDTPADMNGDGRSGIARVDDDGDGSIDEHPAGDDDEDGKTDEDWLDIVAYFQSGRQLIERLPDAGAVDGTGYTERVLADNVDVFRVERVPQVGYVVDLIDVTLTLDDGVASVTLTTRFRVGARG